MGGGTSRMSRTCSRPCAPFKETYNQQWLIERLGFRAPAVVRRAFALTPPREYTHPAVQEIRGGTRIALLDRVAGGNGVWIVAGAQ